MITEMKLRPYQEEAVSSVENEFKDHRSTLVVLPTGAGKTQVFCEVIKRRLPSKALIVVHRKELCWQAVKRLKSFGIDAEVEMGNFRIEHSLWRKPSVIVTSVQTQIAGSESKRMQKFNPNDYETLILDECHHCTSRSWKEVIKYYQQNPNLKLLGVTATPDRSDEEALGQIFESVAYDYEIIDAIHDGWLVPIHQQMVECTHLDFSEMRTTAGDLNGADLANMMEQEGPCHELVKPSIEIIGEKRAIMFASSLKHAEICTGIFNAHRWGMADWIHANTPPEEREEKLKRFDNGDIQVMVNVGILTEGYDSPGVEVILQGRPTKSRSLYSQMVGRGTRPLPGTVDGIDDAESRRNAIAQSPKSNCLVVDFVGNTGRHKLISSMDILGGKVTDEVIEMAIKRAKKANKSVDVTQMLDEEAERLRKQEEARKKRKEEIRSKLKSKVTYKTRSIDPFNIFDITPERERGWDHGKVLSDKQMDLLRKQGLDPLKMTYAQGTQVIRELVRRWKGDLCSLKQANILNRYGFDTKEMSRKAASIEIDKLAKNGWRR